LGFLGQGKIQQALLFLTKASAMDINHQGVQIHKAMAVG